MRLRKNSPQRRRPCLGCAKSMQPETLKSICDQHQHQPLLYINNLMGCTINESDTKCVQVSSLRPKVMEKNDLHSSFSIATQLIGCYQVAKFQQGFGKLAPRALRERDKRIKNIKFKSQKLTISKSQYENKVAVIKTVTFKSYLVYDDKKQKF